MYQYTQIIGCTIDFALSCWFFFLHLQIIYFASSWSFILLLLLLLLLLQKGISCSN
ncbi:hypothetical protein MtrunA17_Chr2g0276761 [Medicago truncatula]|uniref:Transmembrane protein n=1 Tax=Medicago truncatula TaxID=3880 RepID=A0A396J3M8_MEDTR|nr:hypothetical protein MtrunA17_Chr2g0276761 [Medicago truncatula]